MVVGQKHLADDGDKDPGGSEREGWGHGPDDREQTRRRSKLRPPSHAACRASASLPQTAGSPLPLSGVTVSMK